MVPVDAPPAVMSPGDAILRREIIPSGWREEYTGGVEIIEDCADNVMINKGC